MTLLTGYLGFLPPPTMAIKLHLNNISTIPMPAIDRMEEKVKEGRRKGDNEEEDSVMKDEIREGEGEGQNGG